VRGIFLAVAVLVASPFVRRFGDVETVNLTWGETRKFADEIEDDEAFERAIFRREVLILLGIAAVIAARIVFV
jgi:hypothetical protein